MNLYLMGFMGTGKTRVGQSIARKTGWQFIDTDQCISEDAGMSIPEIFEKMGEPYFRELEKKWVKKTSKGSQQVISLGGGAVVDEENWEIIHTHGVTVTLSYPATIIAERLARKKDRPLLNNDDAEERLKQIKHLMDKRHALYQKADFILHLNKEQPVDQVAQAIISLIGDLYD